MAARANLDVLVLVGCLFVFMRLLPPLEWMDDDTRDKCPLQVARCRSATVEQGESNDGSFPRLDCLSSACLWLFFSFYVFFLAGASKRRVPCLFVRYNNHVIGIIMHGSPFKCAPTEGHLADKHFWGLIRL